MFTNLVVNLTKRSRRCTQKEGKGRNAAIDNNANKPYIAPPCIYIYTCLVDLAKTGAALQTPFTGICFF